MAWPHKLFSGQITDIDLRLLRVFRVIVECEGFAAAEGELGVSRSAISKRINDLELRVGARLCERGRSGFSLTDEGRIVYEATVDLLAALDRFRSHVNALHADTIGHLHIGLIDTLVSSEESKLVEAFRAFREAHPKVNLNLMVGTASEIERAVQERRLDIGIVPAASESDPTRIRLFEEVGLLYCSNLHEAYDRPENTLELETLSQYPLVQHAYSLAEAKAIQDLRLSPAASSHQTEGVLFLILSGKYIGFLPDHYARIWEERGRLRALRPDAVRKSTWIIAITSKIAAADPLVKRFLSHF